MESETVIEGTENETPTIGAGDVEESKAAETTAGETGKDGEGIAVAERSEAGEVGEVTVVGETGETAGTEEVGGEHVETEHVEVGGEHVETEHVEVGGEHVETEHVEKVGQHVETEHVEGEHVKGEHLEGEHVESEHVEGEHVKAEHVEGEHVEGEHVEGEPVDVEHVDAEHVEGEELEGEHVEGESVQGEAMEGEHVEGEQAEGEAKEKVEGEELMGEGMEGEHVEGEETEKIEEIVLPPPPDDTVEEEEYIPEPPPDPAAPYDFSDSKEAMKAPFELRPDQLAEVEQLWEAFQNYTPAYSDLDGYITETELVYMLKSLFIMTYTVEQLQELIEYCCRPPHEKGYIFYDQFLKMVTMRQRDFPTEEEIRSALQVFDPAKTALLDREEIRETLTRQGHKMSQKLVDNLIKEVDMSNDGTIGIEDIVGTMCIDLNPEDLEMLRATVFPPKEGEGPEMELGEDDY